MKVKNIEHGVINEVSQERFDYLMKTGEYEEYKEPVKHDEAPKRIRRTREEMEADKRRR